MTPIERMLACLMALAILMFVYVPAELLARKWGQGSLVGQVVRAFGRWLKQPWRVVARWRTVRGLDREIQATNVVPFERPKLDAIGDRWSRAQLDGLVMSPYDLEGHRSKR